MRPHALIPVALSLSLLATSCGDPDLHALGDEGSLEVLVRGIPQSVDGLGLEVLPARGETRIHWEPVAIYFDEATVLFSGLHAGEAQVVLAAYDGSVEFERQSAGPVEIVARQTTRLTLELADLPPPPPVESCNGLDDDGDGATDEDGVCPPPPPPPPVEPEVGCADGEREGFLDLDRYPAIAACSGAWDVPGITRPDLAPTCGRSAGDDGAEAEGAGCAAADLCAAGWHVCDGHQEVELHSPDGCDGAVPAGSPDKSLFFAISQASVQNTFCNDDGQGDNDVFGCGNLGHQLAPDKGCAPLNRALASMNPGSCGYNEAEPGHGPWECQGPGDSHLHEGGLVTKVGCWGRGCSYDGQPVGNSDKGGLLCCVD